MTVCADFGGTKGPWQRSGVRVKLGIEDCIAVGPDGFSILFTPIGRRPEEHTTALRDAEMAAQGPVMATLLLQAPIMLATTPGSMDEMRFIVAYGVWQQKVKEVLARIQGNV